MPLRIDADAVPAGPVPEEGLEAVAWRSPQVLQLLGGIEHLQLPLRGGLDVAESPRA